MSCTIYQKHWFSKHGSMEPVDYCVYCKRPKAEILEEQREHRKRRTARKKQLAKAEGRS